MTEQVNDGGAAFPRPPSYVPGEGWEPGQVGMSLRDFFAGHALAGLNGGIGYQGDCDEIAKRAYQIADSMLKARAK